MNKDLKEELKGLIEEQKLVRAMRESAMNSEKQLNQKFEAFLIKQFKFKDKESFSMIDLLEKAIND